MLAEKFKDAASVAVKRSLRVLRMLVYQDAELRFVPSAQLKLFPPGAGWPNCTMTGSRFDAADAFPGGW